MRTSRIVMIIVILLAIGLIIFLRLNKKEEAAVSQNKPSLIDQTTLASLPTRSTSNIDKTHLASDLKPPTNKWFSGLALQADSKPVFPSPLSFKASNNGYEIGLPKVATSEKLISAPHIPVLKIEIESADNFKVTRYDELSLDITYYAGQQSLGYATITAGSPLVFFTATNPDTVLTVSRSDRQPSSMDFTVNGVSVNTLAFSGATQSGNTINLPKDSFVSSYLLPEGQIDNIKDIAGNKVTSTNVSYVNQESDSVTKLRINTANNKPTLLSLLPHQQTTGNTAELTYKTLYGEAATQVGNEFNYSQKQLAVKSGLDLEGVSEANKQNLITTLRRDINATTLDMEDSYFGAKSAYRASQLLQLAEQLNEDKLSQSIKQKLKAYLDEWFSGSGAIQPRSLYFDPAAHGVVAEKPAFGSEQFNDHHFHYGYFIYAAAILSEYDQEFLNDHKQTINLMVADIANYNNDEAIMLRRTFDPYFGHSWASGTSPFADGNNQESVAEAINAWTATQLWGEVTSNKDLVEQSKWMLASEVATANKYWLEYDKSKFPYNQEYRKNVTSLNWGAKREYNTFFSAEPTAMLGIQLIPMNPTMTSMFTNKARITANINEAGGNKDLSKQFSDYILMYGSSGSSQTLEGQLKQAQSIADDKIDGANSRAYMLAWLLSNQTK